MRRHVQPVRNQRHRAEQQPTGDLADHHRRGERDHRPGLPLVAAMRGADEDMRMLPVLDRLRMHGFPLSLRLQRTEMGMRMSRVEATGLPFLSSGKNRHFFSVSISERLRSGSGVGSTSSTCALPSAAMWKRASAASSSERRRRCSGISRLGSESTRAPMLPPSGGRAAGGAAGPGAAGAAACGGGGLGGGLAGRGRGLGGGGGGSAFTSGSGSGSGSTTGGGGGGSASGRGGMTTGLGGSSSTCISTGAGARGT